MPSYSSHKFPFLSEFSTGDRRLAEKARGDLEASRKKSAEAGQRQVEEVMEKARRQMHDLLGAKNARSLRDVMRRERLSLRDMRQPPQGLTLDFAKANRARKAKAERLLRQFGIDREKIAKIGTDARTRLQSILSKPDKTVVPGYNLALNLQSWKKLSRLHFPLPAGEFELPSDDPNDPHRWFLFQPPWFGFDWWTNFYLDPTDGFTIDHQHVVDPAAGLVGNDLTLDNSDASDSDAAWAEVETYIAFRFEAPTAGLVEVLIDAQSALAKYSLRVDDEWGWSKSWTGQSNFLALRVLHPNVPETSLALMDTYRNDASGDDVAEDRENLIRNAHYYAHLFSSGPVAGGQSVILEIGTRSVDYSWTNDMSVDSRSRYHWFINSVQVRIAP
jgi:hypothetical protein